MLAGRKSNNNNINLRLHLLLSIVIIIIDFLAVGPSFGRFYFFLHPIISLEELGSSSLSFLSSPISIQIITSISTSTPSSHSIINQFGSWHCTHARRLGLDSNNNKIILYHHLTFYSLSTFFSFYFSF